MKTLKAMVCILMVLSVGALVLLPGIYAQDIQDTDNDGIPDSVDVDIDGDGVPNMEEALYGTDPYNANSKPEIIEML